MINKVLTTSRIAEMNALGSDVSHLYKQNPLAGDVMLANLMHTLDEKNATLLAQIKRMRKRSQLMLFDKKRDDGMRALWFLTYGSTFHPNAEINDAASIVYAILENFGLKIINEPYAVESSHIEAMFLQLSDATVADAITKISGCGELLTALKDAQSEFEQVRLNFESVKENEGSYATASDLKKELIQFFNEKLIVYIDGKLVDDENKAVYGNFANTMAQIINDHNAIVRSHRSNDKKDDENLLV